MGGLGEQSCVWEHSSYHGHLGHCGKQVQNSLLFTQSVHSGRRAPPNSGCNSGYQRLESGFGGRAGGCKAVEGQSGGGPKRLGQNDNHRGTGGGEGGTTPPSSTGPAPRPVQPRPALNDVHGPSAPSAPPGRGRPGPPDRGQDWLDCLSVWPPALATPKPTLPKRPTCSSFAGALRRRWPLVAGHASPTPCRQAISSTDSLQSGL